MDACPVGAKAADRGDAACDEHPAIVPGAAAECGGLVARDRGGVVDQRLHDDAFGWNLDGGDK